MKSLLAALLLCGAILCSAAGLVQDTQFSELFEMAAKLNSLNHAWNEHCGEDASQPGCKDVQLKLAVLQVMWIKQAEAYQAVGDPDACDTKMRVRIIAAHVHAFKWNLQYGGRSLEDVDRDKALDGANAIDEETKQIQKDLHECFDNRNNPQSGVATPPELLRL